MAEIHIFSTLHGVNAEQWNACFPDALEDYHFLRVAEEAGIAGFSWRYIIALENGIIVAAIPAFFTHYALDTTLEGAAKKLSGRLRSVFPGALRLRLACIGSPVTEYAMAGFHGSVAPEARAPMLRSMMAMFERHAAMHGYALIGIKDIAVSDQKVWDAAIGDRQYCGLTGLPVAGLTVDFLSMDDYFMRLSAATRKNMRRKLKVRSLLRIEYRTQLDDMLPQIMALYRATRARAEMQFEELTADYFTNLLSKLGGRAHCVLYFLGDELLAANFLLKNGTTLLDKIFCMDARGRDYNLYFVSWFVNLEYCLAHGITQYQSGQAGYETKVRLGSQLHSTTMFFKHRNRLIHGALRIAAPFLAVDAKEAA